jgi:4-hydroxybenzoyl-CoA reductase subunit beta
MGTIGGNLNLDTRCRYVNQTAFWRIALGGGCLKSEGDVCHVVPGGRNCVAAMSSDCVPVAISLDGELELVSPRGRRRVPLSEYYGPDGTAHIKREPDELATALWVPSASGPRCTRYVKWTVRRSIDFPLVSVALRFDLEAGAAARIAGHRIVVGVLGAKPRVISGLDALVGRTLGDPTAAKMVCDAVHTQCKPLENVPFEAGYRRSILRVHVRRAIEAMAAELAHA